MKCPVIPDKALFSEKCRTAKKTIERKRHLGEGGGGTLVERTKGEDTGRNREYTVVSVPQSYWMHRSSLFLDTVWVWKHTVPKQFSLELKTLFAEFSPRMKKIPLGVNDLTRNIKNEIASASLWLVYP